MRSLMHVPIVVAGLAVGIAAQGPTVGPTVAMTMHSVSNVNCQGNESEQWLLTYGPPPCFLPPGFPTGSPFITGIRVRLTPVDTSQPPRIVTVPRSSVYRTETAAGCTPTPAPCLSVRVASVPGPFLADVAFIDGQGMSSAWSEPPLPAVGPAGPGTPATGIRPVGAWRLRP